jgi:hypothetical protein
MGASLDHAQVTALLERWTAAGFIDARLADRMRADAVELDTGTEPGSPDRRRALAVEALAYLGSAVVVVGAALIAAQFWSDMAAAVRIAVVAAASGVLLLAGSLAHGDVGGAPARLRAVLFLASTAATAGALGLLANDVLGLAASDSFVLVSAGTAGYAVALWVVTRSPVQQVAMMVAGAATAAAVISRADVDPDLTGLGVWAVGVAWAALGWAGALSPRRLALALGAASAIFGAMLTAGSDLGLLLVLCTVGASVAAAVIAQDLVLLGVAAVGVVVNVPVAMQRWFPDSLAGAFALVVAGLALVGMAVWISRHGGTAERSRP